MKNTNLAVNIFDKDKLGTKNEVIVDIKFYVASFGEKIKLFI